MMIIALLPSPEATAANKALRQQVVDVAGRRNLVTKLGRECFKEGMTQAHSSPSVAQLLTFARIVAKAKFRQRATFFFSFSLMEALATVAHLLYYLFKKNSCLTRVFEW